MVLPCFASPSTASAEVRGEASCGLGAHVPAGLWGSGLCPQVQRGLWQGQGTHVGPQRCTAEAGAGRAGAVIAVPG